MEVVESAQNVVMPPRWEGEPKKNRLDDGTGAMGAEQPVLQEEFPPAPLRSANGRKFVSAVRCRALGSLAVPSAIGHLLAKQVIGDCV